MASWESAGTLVHYHYHYHDSCRWWDSQPYHPPSALGCTLQHLVVTSCTSNQFTSHPWSYCGIVLPASTLDTQIEQIIVYVLQASARNQATTWFSPTNTGCHGQGKFSQSHSCHSPFALEHLTKMALQWSRKINSVIRPVSAKPALFLL